jgi:hypothetical protein
MRILNDLIIDTASVTSAGLTSSQQDVQHMYGLDLTAVVTVVSGSPSGTIKLQKSNDPASVASKTWFDIASSSQAWTGATTLNWAYADVSYPFIRAVVANTTGVAGVTLRINGKGA